ncbi:phospholipid scramblase family protein [Vibrio sp.]|nr:phospholipid scramblase family protein [Vibrio sp.]
MDAITDLNVYLIKEHVGLFKAANNYDIYDPSTGQIIMECREPVLGFITKMLRFTDYKRHTPFDVQIRTPNDQRIVRVQRGISLFLSDVEVRDENNELIGRFSQKLFSIGGKFDVQDRDGNELCQLEGNWIGWDFRFKRNEQEIARVTKKWAGLGREMITSADNYVLEIAESVSAEDPIRKLILAAVMCIDMVLKE